MIQINIVLFLLISQVALCGDWQIFNTINAPLPSNKITSIEIDANGNKWIGTDNGLAAYDGQNWAVYDIQDSLVDNTITDILYKNYSSQLWIATNKGISVFSISSINDISPKEIFDTNNSGIISNATLSLAHNQNISWVGTQNGLSILSGTVWENYTRFDLLPNNVILSIASQTDGWNFLITEGGGVSRLKYDVDGITSASTITSEWSGLPTDTVQCVLIDNEQNRWFGTQYGASKHFGDNTKTNWQQYSEGDGLINNYILSIEKDSSGAIWFGTTKGLSRLYNNFWNSWTVEDSLPADSIFDIACDAENNIWLATNNGLVKITKTLTSLSAQSINIDLHRLETKVYPNPFNSRIRFSLNLKKSENMSIDIFSIAGKLIKSLYTGHTNPGKFEIEWNGKDNYQTKVASGIYFAQIRTNDINKIVKLTLIK